MTTHAVKAEYVKFTSTRGYLIGIVCLLPLGLMIPLWKAIQARTTPEVLTPSSTLGGVSGFGLMVLMVLATLSVTQEYRFNTAQVGFLGLPGKWQWLSAKAILMGSFAVIASAFMTILAMLATRIIAPSDKQQSFDLATCLPTIGIVALVSAILTVLAVGIGALLRSSPAAVALILIWPNSVELLLSRLPGMTETTPKFLIWTNVVYAMTGKTSDTNFLWNRYGAIAYLTALAGIVFLWALGSTRRRPVQ